MNRQRTHSNYFRNHLYAELVVLTSGHQVTTESCLSCAMGSNNSDFLHAFTFCAAFRASFCFFFSSSFFSSSFLSSSSWSKHRLIALSNLTDCLSISASSAVSFDFTASVFSNLALKSSELKINILFLMMLS